MMFGWFFSGGEETVNHRIRIIVLCGLCFQNSSHALLRRYSQAILEEKYSSFEVVFVAELIKLIFCAFMSVKDVSLPDGNNQTILQGCSRLWFLALNSQKVVALVFMYSTMNVLTYYALARVNASIYTVLNQLRVVTTAVFSMLILKRQFSAAKWRALILLILGCILVASPTLNKPDDSEIDISTDMEPIPASIAAAAAKDVTKYTLRRVLAASLTPVGQTNTLSVIDVTMGEALIGVGACLLMVILSGASVTYFELILKPIQNGNSNVRTLTIWERNFQLALFSVFLSVAFAIVAEVASGNDIWKYQLFKGWSAITVLIAVIQAIGGLLVAATLKYADSVLKTLSTSGAIVISTVLGYLLLQGECDMFVVIGCIATILAIMNYSFDLTPEGQ